MICVLLTGCFFYVFWAISTAMLSTRAKINFVKRSVVYISMSRPPQNLGYSEADHLCEGHTFNPKQILCCSMYCLCVNVHCTTATACQNNCR